MTTADEKHRAEVKAAIRKALAAGANTLEEIWSEAGGADVRFVSELLDEIAKAEDTDVATNTMDAHEAEARRRTANLPLVMPAADPMRSQWWFTLDTAVSLARRAADLAAAGAAAFLGAPTTGLYYAYCFRRSTIVLDADEDVIGSLDLPPECQAVVYDIYDSLPLSFTDKHSVVVIDPPWYPTETRLFISRARELLSDSGFILCILPSRLTRPGLIEERTDLLTDLISARYEVVALESAAVRYRVPEFETAAYRDLEGFHGRPWRQGDLLILRVSPSTVPTLQTPGVEQRISAKRFARNVKQLRIFLREDLSSHPTETMNWIEPIPDFERSVSTRAIPTAQIEIWSTSKKGARISHSFVAEAVLRAWARGFTLQETVEELYAPGSPVAESQSQAQDIASDFHSVLGLWDSPPGPSHRRPPARLRELRSKILSDLAMEPSSRQYDFHDDQFRLGFQRDRDRVLWSHALKRLANKTQVFPVQSDDHLRRRLSHSIEVMQLASTISTAFGLDRDLTEAGALAHDLGQTPFGHAGEHALDSIISEIDPNLGGFNHYEHGCDIVRWLEDVYQSPGAGGFPGLNLTNETVECIFKHCYHRDSHPLSQTILFSRSKHQYLGDTTCHLEGQAVRIADKISYLISDLEDGIRMEVLTLRNLQSCKLFDHPPIDLSPSRGETFFERFISQRRSLLQVLMEDILIAADGRLAKKNTKAAIRASREYTVAYSPVVNAEVTEVWNTLQVGILHRDRRVVAANIRAAKIVTELFLLYALVPELIEERFHRSHTKLIESEYVRHYTNQLGNDQVGIPKRRLDPFFLDKMIGADLKSQGDNWLVPVYNLILAKDYVANLTDRRARQLYSELLRGSEQH